MDSTEAYVALNLLPGVGPIRVRRLLSHFGSPQAIFLASESELLSIQGIGPETASNIRNWHKNLRPDHEIALAQRLGAKILTPESPDYPSLLLQIHDPPTVLYLLGQLPKPNQCTIAIVGTRKPSLYGSESARKLAFELASAGASITSGLALGIDSHAHQATLQANGHTTAILGSGLAHIYPRSNRQLARKILDSGGAILSEFPIQTPPDPQTFPIRNRIISGISHATLVVEADPKSGALITANLALEQGRPIYAIPGRIDNPLALGSNRLIQQGAKLVISANDILYDLTALLPDNHKPHLAPPKQPLNLNQHQSLIFQTLSSSPNPVHINQIIEKTGLPTHIVSSNLIALELLQLIKQLPGSFYTKNSFL
ncbi:MAG: DNA-processing protein DprA [Chthoniobacterales bacterium]|nr:DNA-processing protein DprA [Chthoniobacterales bacterium]